MTSIKIEPASYFGAQRLRFFCVCNVCMGALWSLVYALVSDACLLLYVYGFPVVTGVCLS